VKQLQHKARKQQKVGIDYKTQKHEYHEKTPRFGTKTTKFMSNCGRHFYILAMDIHHNVFIQTIN